MAKLLVGIAAHPKREQHVQKLLDGPLWGFDSRLNVTWDREDDLWDTHERAWMGLLEQAGSETNTDTTHALVLQDDAVPCRNLVPGVEMALDALPADALVSLYFGNALSHPKIVRSARSANEHKASWIVSTGYWWGVAVLLPISKIEEMLAFCCPRRENYDRRLSIWCEYNEYPVYYPWPSLVDHLDDTSLKNPGRRPGRKAYQFVGEDYSALSFDPNGPDRKSVV